MITSKMAFAAVTLSLLVGGLVAGCSAANPSSSSASQASTSASANTCDAKYIQSPFERGAQNHYMIDGVASLKLSPATPATEKRDAYLSAAGHDVVLLGGYAYAAGLWDDPNNTAPLISGACLSPKGQEIHTMLAGAWTANGANAANAATPASGTNSGISGGKVVVATAPGMRAGRTGLRITFANGSSIFIDDACGNVIFPGTPSKTIPRGPTDQCPPGTTGTPPHCLAVKIPSTDPAPRGNAPVGGGTNVYPGPGAYVPPAQMSQPPAAPYVAPAAPKATKPPVGSVPDPVPAPAPQPAAPKPAAPASQCAVVPGLNNCPA